MLTFDSLFIRLDADYLDKYINHYDSLFIGSYADCLDKYINHFDSLFIKTKADYLDNYVNYFDSLFIRSDTDYLDGYIKPDLMRRVSESFPDDFANNDIARNQCRDKIIECVKYAMQVCEIALNYITQTFKTLY